MTWHRPTAARSHRDLGVWAVGAIVASVLVATSALVATTAYAQGLTPVAAGFVQPLGIVAPPDGTARLFVVEQRGTVAVVDLAPADGGAAEPRRWLDLQGRTRAQGERGLLGLAFHPDFGANGRVFVSYTDADGTSIVSELRTEPDAATVDAAGEVVLFSLAQPYANHNGGQIAFGPDGYLYLGLGDGGSGGDPLASGQDRGTLLGAILRFDVDAGGPGTLVVPDDNPFVDDPAARDEIWAYGLRNPWRFSFDPRTGDLWIADVGQNAVEEVDLLPAGAPGGANFGWNVLEGDRCFAPASGCDPSDFVAPVATYTHASGWGRSITGGVVPYGPAAPSLAGRYVFGDFGSGRLFVLDPVSDGYEASALLDAGFPVAAFGLDANLDAYVADYGGGVLYRLED